MPGDLYWRVSIASSGASYDASDDLSSLTVEQKEGGADSLVADFADPYKVLSHAFQEGADVEVELGTDDDHAIVFRGRVYKVDGSFPTTQTPTLTIRAYDASMRMGLRRRSRPFADMRLSDIVRKVASDYFSRIDIDIDAQGDPQFPGNGVRQQEETDAAFLRRLAESYGCLLHVAIGDSDDTFKFVSQKKVMTAKPDVSLFYGRSDVPDRLLSFEANVDAAQIELPRLLSGIDYDTGQATEMALTTIDDAGDVDDSCFSENLAALAGDHPDKADALASLAAGAEASQALLRADLGASVREAIAGFTTEDQQNAMAQNQFSTRLHGMTGSGATVGIRRLVAQSAVWIGDVGGRFSGAWFLSSVRHILDAQGYRTEFECRR
jgi:phage protein D